jgi:hypothetical protein
VSEPDEAKLVQETMLLDWISLPQRESLYQKEKIRTRIQETMIPMMIPKMGSKHRTSLTLV